MPARAWVVPDTTASHGTLASTHSVHAVEMNSSEWLRGCPEGSEQALLFGAYSQLCMGSLTCASCKAAQPSRLPELDIDAFSTSGPSAAKKNESNGKGKTQADWLAYWPAKHLLLLFPRPEQLLAHMFEALCSLCVSCGEEICGACGQKYKTAKDGADKGGPKGKRRLDDDLTIDTVLFHCGLTQSAILGCGLTMVSKYHAAQSMSNPTATLQSIKQTKAGIAQVAGPKADKTSGGEDINDDFLLATCPIFTNEEISSKSGSSHLSSKAVKTSKASSPGAASAKASAGGLTHKAVPKIGGIGYSGNAHEEKGWKAESLKRQQARDGILEQMLRVLRTYIPNSERTGTSAAHDAEADALLFPTEDGQELRRSEGERVFESDWMPDFTTLAHLRRRFLPLASSLLSSDSLTDMIDRQSLFIELLRWFAIFARHETLCPLLAQPIMQVSGTRDVLDKDGNVKAREKTTVYEGSAGPMELMQSILAQCKTFKNTMEVSLAAERKKQDEEIAELHAAAKTLGEKIDPEQEAKIRESKLDPEQQTLLSFCDRIIRIVKVIEQQLRKTKGDAAVDKLLGIVKQSATKASSKSERSSKEPPPEQEQAKIYEAWAKSQVFADDVDMRSATSTSAAAVTWQHVFSNEIRACNSTAMRRNVTISKELATMQVNLPSFFHGSIFVRRDESRVDVLKACIIGPEGSPYESGCYLFDLFLPANYNQEPPKCKIVNTKGGMVRHNPNLYKEGKVCLSLLG